ncbi:MAG: 30S ribosomal protein S9 [Candidatus Kariarchaeaceae archaeon]|jgi:small subunit ribosomal protein S9
MSNVILSSGKRRTAIARARFMEVDSPDKAIIRINGTPVEQIENKFARLRMMEPIYLLSEYYQNNLSIKIRVQGGGVSSRAEAVRMAIARGLNQYLNSKEVTEILEGYDRTMISGDVRRTEAKKYGGPGARARFQKSYR